APGEPAVLAVAATAPAAAAAAAGEQALDGFHSVAEITWEPQGEGLLVIISTDGYLAPDRYRHYRLEEEPPRQVIQLFGATRRFDRRVLAVDSPLLRQIRVGFHAGAERSEQRVVLDLADAGVEVAAMETDGTSLRVSLARAGE
ncbi:MAG TPA: hypothetical protein VMT16_16980, partial [Thermoanaerobaculia bacterium]|nr:hypothetical protein [Thermoanaerobaculia bacterium]